MSGAKKNKGWGWGGVKSVKSIQHFFFITSREEANLLAYVIYAVLNASLVLHFIAGKDLDKNEIMSTNQRSFQRTRIHCCVFLCWFGR